MADDTEQSPRNFGGTEDNDYVASAIEGERRVTIEIDIPDVEVSPIRTQVRCGSTAVEIGEYGVRGSGEWAAWKSGGYTVDDYRGTYDGALEIAKTYVRKQERRRLMHEALNARLDGSA